MDKTLQTDVIKLLSLIDCILPGRLFAHKVMVASKPFLEIVDSVSRKYIELDDETNTIVWKKSTKNGTVFKTQTSALFSSIVQLVTHKFNTPLLNELRDIVVHTNMSPPHKLHLILASPFWLTLKTDADARRELASLVIACMYSITPTSTSIDDDIAVTAQDNVEYKFTKNFPAEELTCSPLQIKKDPKIEIKINNVFDPECQDLRRSINPILQRLSSPAYTSNANNCLSNVSGKYFTKSFQSKFSALLASQTNSLRSAATELIELDVRSNGKNRIVEDELMDRLLKWGNMDNGRALSLEEESNLRLSNVKVLSSLIQSAWLSEVHKQYSCNGKIFDCPEYFSFVA